MFEQIIWGLPTDRRSNYRHILDGHDVTIAEVEEVLQNPTNPTVVSRKSGHPIVFGRTRSGKYIAVVYEHVLDDPRTCYPITAYPVRERGSG